MDVRVLQGDALEIAADVLVLKYAQAAHGVDSLVIARLEAAGHALENSLPKPESETLVETGGAIAAKSVLFVGVVTLRAFGYEEIRAFSTRALRALAEKAPSASHVVFTLHGVGYGLDESEAFRAELAGILDAADAGECPKAIERVTIVERDAARVARLQALLGAILAAPAGRPSVAAPALQSLIAATRGGLAAAADRPIPKTAITEQTPAAALVASPIERLQSAGALSVDKPHVFVAMPFAHEFDDSFHYGIYQPVHAAGYLCERADLATFTGDVIAWVKARIDTASLLVADLSTANPNVYLEVGYAWGKGVPAVLLARTKDDLRFDVQNQRCLVYNNSIMTLEDMLTNELKHLRPR